MDQLQVVDGELSDVYDPSKKAIAAVYRTDDYGRPIEESHCAKPGDKVALHYVYEWEYIDDETEAKIAEEDLADYDRPVTEKEVKSADITYEAAACGAAAEERIDWQDSVPAHTTKTVHGIFLKQEQPASLFSGTRMKTN